MCIVRHILWYVELYGHCMHYDKLSCSLNLQTGILYFSTRMVYLVPQTFMSFYFLDHLHMDKVYMYGEH